MSDLQGRLRKYVEELRERAEAQRRLAREDLRGYYSAAVLEREACKIEGYVGEIEALILPEVPK